MANVAPARTSHPSGASARRPSQPHPQILLAIGHQRVLSLVYRGQPLDFEPYLYGRMLSGKEFLFGWQRNGPFASWRVLGVPFAHSLRATEQCFEAPRPGYHISGLAHVAALYAHLAGVQVPQLVTPEAPRARR